MNNHRPSITVLIPTCNRPQFLPECLESVVAQTLPACQIVVINDGPADDTKSICRAYGENVQYVESNHSGKSAAVNRGLQKVTGDYVWILDDDDVAAPDALARFSEPLESRQECGFSYSQWFVADTNPEDGRIGSVRHHSTMPHVETEGFLLSLLRANFLTGAAVFARSACYREVGGFDAELLRSQDYEMAIRLSRRFKGIRVQGPPTFYYRQHDGPRGLYGAGVPATHRRRQWLEFDQRFFRRLYADIPLSEYLPPGDAVDEKRRKALLQRMAIMAAKMLVEQVIADCGELARAGDRTPISREEYVSIRAMVVDLRFNDAGGVYDRIEWWDEVRRLASASAAVRLLRPQLIRALLARVRADTNLRSVGGMVRRVFHLYFDKPKRPLLDRRKALPLGQQRTI